MFVSVSGYSFNPTDQGSIDSDHSRVNCSCFERHKKKAKPCSILIFIAFGLTLEEIK